MPSENLRSDFQRPFQAGPTTTRPPGPAVGRGNIFPGGVADDTSEFSGGFFTQLRGGLRAFDLSQALRRKFQIDYIILEPGVLQIDGTQLMNRIEGMGNRRLIRRGTL